MYKYFFKLQRNTNEMNSIFKKIIVPIRRFIKFADNCFIKLACRNSLLASFYYTFLSKAFYQEHKSALAGRVLYKNNNVIGYNPSVLLRRNIHRLEKGIIIKPRRDVFAISYIDDTVKAYEQMLSSCSNRNEASGEIQWAHDVLKEYFLITSNFNQTINNARSRFNKLSSMNSNNSCKPYYRNIPKKMPVEYEDLLFLSKLRRSVRFYKQTAVPHEIIDKAISIAAQAPSACNRQPYKFLVFDNPEKIKAVSEIPTGTKGFNHNFPGIIAIVGSLSAYFNERDRHVIYIDSSLAAMAFIYALEVQGVSSCVINWPDKPILEREMREVLKMKPDECLVMLLSYGYPDLNAMVPYSHKKELNQIRTYNI